MQKASLIVTDACFDNARAMLVRLSNDYGNAAFLCSVVMLKGG
jgi:hypothetical protein